ncbi:hypothetical protein ACFL2M_01400 [Patescibacteria group bacterium]
MDEAIITPKEIDQLKSELVSWLFGVQRPVSEEATNQIIRTQVDPALYEAVGRLNDLMTDGGPRFTRLVAEWMGYDELAGFFPQAAAVVRVYQKGADDPELLGQTFRELSVLAAMFNRDILSQLYAAVVAVKTSDNLYNRFHQHQAIPEKIFWQEISDIKTQATVAGQEQESHWLTDIQPVHAVVAAEGAPEGVPAGEAQAGTDFYRIPVTLRLFNPVQEKYDVQIHQPSKVERYEVEKEVTIPWERAAKGVQLEISLSDERGLYHLPERYYLTPAQLELIRQRGTEVPTRLGKNGEIRFFPEYIQKLPGEIYHMPEDTLVSLRVTNSAVEIRKKHHNARLTVFV